MRSYEPIGVDAAAAAAPYAGTNVCGVACVAVSSSVSLVASCIRAIAPSHLRFGVLGDAVLVDEPAAAVVAFVALSAL